jgi:hypothetical protein
MSRRPDYSLLRDAEKSGRDALNQHIDNQKTAAEQTRPAFNSHALQALRNMDGSLEGQQRLAQDLMKAHAEDRANRLEQNKRAALDQHLEMSNGGEGQSLGHRPDYSLLQKDNRQARDAAVETSPDHGRDALNQHLEMSPEREGESLGHRPDYSLLQKDNMQEREAAVEASPGHAREELDQHLTTTDARESQERQTAIEPDRAEAHGSAREALDQHIEAENRREPQAPDLTEERNTRDPSLEQDHQPEKEMEKDQNLEAQRDVGDAGEAQAARNDPSLDAREAQMEPDRAESNGSAREALDQHIEQGDRGNQVGDRTEERDTGDPSLEQDHQPEKGMERDQNLEAQQDAANAWEAQKGRDDPSLER